jgi:diguanylate cyclase (GGDEF)-like protein
MAQYNQTENNINSNGFEVDLDNQSKSDLSVLDMARYKNAENAVKIDTSAFHEVMLQMNIADKNTFDNQFFQLWNEASEQSECLFVFICEIDSFNVYYKKYGHQSASFMLIVVGLALKKICEENDCFLAHYKNEGFRILMKGGSERHAAEIGETLRKAVENTQTEHKYSDVSKVITLSIGISSVYPTSMNCLIKKADFAINKAKSAGYNKVCVNFEQRKDAELSLNINPTKQEKVLPTPPSPIVSDAKLKQLMLDLNVHGRNSFQRDFAKLWHESIKEEELLSILICKVDYFHTYIESYGKQSSIDVLLMVAHALNLIHQKFGGKVYHAGGEKFIILLKGGNATNAFRIAEHLHKLVNESYIEHNYSPISNFITLSSGLSSLFPDTTNSMKMLMGNVDKALKSAIEAGQNQTSVE